MIAIAPQYTTRDYRWTAWKAAYAIKGSPFQYDQDDSQYLIWTYDEPEAHICTIWKGEVPPSTIGAGYTQEQNDADKADFESKYKPSGNGAISTKTPDNRSINASNRIPLGYTVYPTGAGDNIPAGTYNDGANLVFSQANPTVDFQMLGHWYGLGGRLVWESASLADRMDAWLMAPASSGFTQAAGDFNRVDIPGTGGTLHIFVPAAPGTGAWSADLTAKIGSSNKVLKATPVPQAGNTGFFDYDSDTNIVTPNYSQKGGYNLYDFDIKLFKFANAIWGRKGDGNESVLESTDVLGKLLYNMWKIRFTLTASTADAKCGVIITTATKKNL